MRKRKRRKSRSFGKLLLLAFLLGAALFHWLSATTIYPAEALARAIRLLEEGDSSQVKPLIPIASQEPSIRHWASLIDAKVEEKDGNYQKAAAKYRKVPSTSAASLDARIGLLRLREFQSDPNVIAGKAIGEFMASLREDIRSAERRDLRQEFEFLEAKSLEQISPIQALKAYTEIRRKFPRSSFAEKARAAQAALLSTANERLPAPSASSLLNDAKILKRERNFEDALKSIQEAKKLTAPSSPARFELLLHEEKINRALGRKEEAERALLLVSADGDKNSAPEALFRIARNAWNVNDHHRALDFLGKLRERFPGHKLVKKSRYYEARILEEMKLPAEARDMYLTLLKKSDENSDDVRTYASRVAWLYLTNDDLVHAALYFAKLKSIAKTQLARENSKPSNYWVRKEKIADLGHAMYWLAHTLEQLPESAVKELDSLLKKQKLSSLGDSTQKAKESAAQIKAELAEIDHHGYYKTLSLRDRPSKERQIEGSLQTTVSKGDNTPCFKQVTPGLLKKLEALRAANLESLITKEVTWHFRNAHSLIPPKGPGLEKERYLFSKARTYLTEAKILDRYGVFDRSISFAQRADASLAAIPQADLESPTNAAKSNAAKSDTARSNTGRCQRELSPLLYPLPHLDNYRRFADQYKVELPLLFAISRTESKFDTEALSSKGAQGLMQLMPAVAKMEGLAENESIFSPSVNIRLGSKHFASLVRQYDGELTYAIAAYNAGSAAVNRWRARHPELSPAAWTELIGYPETKNYVKKVLSSREMYRNKIEQETARAKLQ